MQWITADQPVLLGGAIQPVTKAAIHAFVQEPKVLKATRRSTHSNRLFLQVNASFNYQLLITKDASILFLDNTLLKCESLFDLY